MVLGTMIVDIWQHFALNNPNNDFLEPILNAKKCLINSQWKQVVKPAKKAFSQLTFLLFDIPSGDEARDFDN